MMDFKTQLIADLKTFHNPGEFAEIMNIWYEGNQYTIPAIIDHMTSTDRKKPGSDNAEGVYRAEAVLYISHEDIGIIPQKGQDIEIEEAGAVNLYSIEKSNYEAGEIVLELGAYTE